MIKDIDQWKREISDAANNKFPNNLTWSQYERLESIQRQLDDVLNAVKVEDGLLHSDDHAHQDANHRVAALIADILIFAQMRDFDIEIELQKVLDWFKNE